MMRRKLPLLAAALLAMGGIFPPQDSDAVAVRYSLVANFDGTRDTGFPLGNKPDTGGTLPDCWNVVEVEDGTSPTVPVSGFVTEFESGTNQFHISTTGGRIFGSDDAYAGFTCEFSSDVIVTADLLSASKNSNSKFGLDLRDSNDDGDEHLFVGVFKTTGLLGEYRGTADGETSSVFLNTPDVPLPECLRISVDRSTSARVFSAPTGPCASASYSQLWEIEDDWIDTTFNINMAVASGTAGGTSTGVFGSVTVNTNPVTHIPSNTGFVLSAQSCSEEVGNCAIQVTRSSPGEGPVDISVNFTNGSAQAGTHFTGGTTCNTAYDYADTQAGPKTCNVPIVDFDGVVQGERNFQMGLVVNSGGDTLGPVSTTITITDEDAGFAFNDHTPAFSPQQGLSGFGLQEWDNVITGSEDYEYRFVTNLSTSSTTAGSLNNAYNSACPANTICVVIPTLDGKITQSSQSNKNLEGLSRFVYLGHWAPGNGLHTEGQSYNLRGTSYMLWQMYSCFNKEPAGGVQSRASCFNAGSANGAFTAQQLSFVNVGGQFAWDTTVNVGLRATNVDILFPLVGPSVSQAQLLGENPGNLSAASTNMMIFGGVYAHVRQRCPLFNGPNGLIAGQVCYNFAAQALRTSGFVNNSMTSTWDIVDVLFVRGPDATGAFPVRWSTGDGTKNITVFIDGIRGFPDSGVYDDTPISNMIEAKTNNQVTEAGGSVATLPNGFVRTNIPAGDAGEQEYAEENCALSGPYPIRNRLPAYQAICNNLTAYFEGSGDPGEAELGGPIPAILSTTNCDPFTANSCFPGQPALPAEENAGDAGSFINAFWTANQAAFCAQVPAGYPGCP